MYLLSGCQYSVIILHRYSISWDSAKHSGSCYVRRFVSCCQMYVSYTPYGSSGAAFQSDSWQIISDQNQCPLCDEGRKYQRNGRTVNPCFSSTSQNLNNIFLPTWIHTASTSTVFYKYFFFCSSYKNSKNKIYISIGSVHKILLILPQVHMTMRTCLLNCSCNFRGSFDCT